MKIKNKKPSMYLIVLFISTLHCIKKSRHIRYLSVILPQVYATKLRIARSMNQWFLLQNEKVLGPFSETEIKAQILNQNSASECLIWGRDNSAWISYNQWQKQLEEALTNTSTEITASAPSANAQMWHYAINGVSKGPLTRGELLTELRIVKQNSEILVWTKGMKSWVDIYEFHDLVEELGLNKRTHPRAAINGSVIIKHSDKVIMAHLRTISPGGFGATHVNSMLSVGDAVSIEIKSESLSDPILTQATVQHISETGFYGFKFSNIHLEQKSLILAYINQTRSVQAA